MPRPEWNRMSRRRGKYIRNRRAIGRFRSLLIAWTGRLNKSYGTPSFLSLPFPCPQSRFHHSLFPIPFSTGFLGVRLGRADDRYLRIQGETPEVLACNSSGILQNKDFPKCRACNGATDVEFQIMPGLLAQMDSDVGGPQELDWGVLNVLTCQKSCMPPDGKDRGFVEEYLWRQEVSLEGLKSGE